MTVASAHTRTDEFSALWYRLPARTPAPAGEFHSPAWSFYACSSPGTHRVPLLAGLMGLSRWPVQQHALQTQRGSAHWPRGEAAQAGSLCHQLLRPLPCSDSALRWHGHPARAVQASSLCLQTNSILRRAGKMPAPPPSPLLMPVKSSLGGASNLVRGVRNQC
jgi:hypothetical protein